eukprot:TRINITY_DN15381_c0_g1_i1.p1 TRINITY_DN15381_c0_g1~~TRINITY_DN15381_c0_g1_i1.p1  ORF type:complete len:198 (-),score=67.52 TRINITY_DN15381_c0_g1_i1:670-1263(-)
MELFQTWLADATRAGLQDPNAMCLATATPEGRPSSRFVLLKGCDADGGFVFYTNYDSRKARELEANPFAAATFWWAPLHRSVRVEGAVARVSAVESDAYYASRPRGSRLGAWVSDQSQPVAGGDAMDAKQQEVEARFGADDAAGDVPRPPHWGGYRVIPDRIEFWGGHPSRLHDRLVYTRSSEGGGGGEWAMQRLQP